MKKFMLLMMLAATLSANATTRVGGEDESNDLVLKKNDNSEWTMHLALGVNVPVSVEGDHKFAPFKSWNIMWTPFQYDYKPKGATQTYSAGVAISWHNYTLKDNGSMFTPRGRKPVCWHTSMPAAWGQHLRWATCASCARCRSENC